MNRILYFDDANHAREYLKRESHPFPVAFQAKNGTVSVHTFTSGRELAEAWVLQNMKNMGLEGEIVDLEEEE